MEKQNSSDLPHPSLNSQDGAAEVRDHGKDTSLEESATTPAEEDWEYVTGIRLAVVLAACTLFGFLMLLDTSIVATVSAISTWSKLSLS